MHKGLGHAAGRDTGKQLGFGTPPPLDPPSPPGPSPPPQGGSGSQKVRRRRQYGERTAGREGAREEAGNWAAALKFPARCAGAPGHAGALGPRDSMKGGDRAYTRSPFLGWLFAKCCCCLPCRGEWLSEFTLSFSQRGAAECTLGVR